MNSGRHAMDISKELSTHSLLSALHRFVDAVDYMDETVMIPSRLRDMEMSADSADDWISTHQSKKNGHIHHSAPPSPTFFNVGGTKRRHSTMEHHHYEHQPQESLMSGVNGTTADEQNLYNFYNLLKAIKHEVVSGTPALQESGVGPGIGGGGGCQGHSQHHITSFELDPPAGAEDYHSIMPAMCSALADQEDEDEACSAVDTEEDTDSVISDTSVGTTEESSRKVATSFRHHLRSLFGLLSQFTQTAKYLSHRYESEVGQSSASQVSSFAF